MVSRRTHYRIERTKILKEIMDLLWILSQYNETKLEHIPLKSLTNVKQDLEELIRNVTYGDRYISDTHIYVNKHDDTLTTIDEN